MMLSTSVVALALASALAVEPPAVQRLEAVCAEAEMAEFGLECSAEEPCPVLVELSAIGQAGSRLIVAGNLHTATATLWSVLLVSSDDGHSWSEPQARLRATVFDQLQVVDPETGFVAGQIAGALAMDPFVLKTSDGGQTWRKVALFDETAYASVEELWFDSRTHGRVLVLRKGGASGRYQLLETDTGGDHWSLREVSDRPLGPVRPRALALAMPVRLRVDSAAQQYVVERRQASGWTPLARFELKAGMCRPAPPAPVVEAGPAAVAPPGAAR